MSYKAYIFRDPLDGPTAIRLDSGVIVVGVADTHPDNGVECQSLTIPDGTAQKNGATLELKATDYFTESYHGILYLDEPVAGRAMLMIDVFHLTKVPPPVIIQPPEPPIPPQPPTGGTPLEIINAVYGTGKYELVTKNGCGQFNEACTKALHTAYSDLWGHIKKFPPQNMYNGHAVDANMLLRDAGDTEAGIYDIITDSESVNAKPAFNYKGPPDKNLWYYPA